MLGLTITLAVSAQNITTLAGGGPVTGLGATAFGIQLPTAIAVDAAGNLYVASDRNSQVYVISSAGVLTQVIGTGASGYSGDGGQAANARLSNFTLGVAVDGHGNLYIADSGNNVVRKVSGGIITTVAGNGTGGYNGDSIPATNAELSFPEGLAVDSSGNLFIADTGGNRVRKVSGGIITTVAGNGTGGYNGDNVPAIAAELSSPLGLAVASNSDLFIADAGGNRVRKVSGGTITSVAGNGTAGYNGDDISATAAELNSPWGLAVAPNGDLLIADSNNYRIRRVTGG